MSILPVAVTTRRLALFATYLLSLAMLVGCASVPDANNTASLPELVKGAKMPELIFHPTLNESGTAEIGQSIISRSFVRKYPAIYLMDKVSDGSIIPGYTVNLDMNELSLFRQSAEGKYYKASEGRATMDFIVLGSKQTIQLSEAGVFVPEDKNKAAVAYLTWKGQIAFGKEHIMVSQETIHEKWNKESFKRELVYGGVFQNVLTLSYREFKDDIARPAFTQELKYDLSQEKVIGYKGARFEVINATNTGLTYKVLKHLD
ncbi:MAG: hypothetical protein U1E84_09915 [Rhodoferax sp.]